MELTVVVLADTETHGDLGRLANALETAAEAADAGADVELVFDGAAVRWVARLEDPDHKRHALWRGLKPRAGVCVYCARAFGVLAVVRAAGVKLLDEHRGHPSLYGRLARGGAVLTF
ncbi:DsrE family protein [Oceanithermus profundus]